MQEKSTLMYMPRDPWSIVVTIIFFLIIACAGLVSLSWLVAQLPLFSDSGWRWQHILFSALGVLKWPYHDASSLFSKLSQLSYPWCLIPYFPLLFAGLVGTGGSLFGWWLSAPHPARQHLAGRQLLSGDEAQRKLQNEMNKEVLTDGQGVEVYPEVSVSLDRETKHFLACGGTGSGKTTVLFPIVREIKENGQRLLIYDNKGEWTERIDGIIFAPWDKRCVAWDISEDILNIADARAFSEAVIKDSSDPMWSNAARAILTAVIVSLIREKENWNLTSILEEIYKGYKHIRGLIYQYTPEAVGLVESQEITKTAQSFLIVLSSYMSTLADLAAAWQGKKQRVSFRRWLLSNQSSGDTIILQGNQRYRPLEQAYIQAIMAVIGGVISSPELEESTQRKIWFCFDEIAQVGKVPSLTKMLEIGRSKGIRVILGLQDISQIREIYGDRIAETWAANVGTYFIGRTQGVETAKFLADLIGKEKVRKYMPVYSGGYRGSTAEARQDSWQESDEYLIRPDEMSSDLGKRKDGVDVLLMTGGAYAYLLRWPFIQASKIRPSVVAADWTTRKNNLIQSQEVIAVATKEGSKEKEGSTEITEQGCDVVAATSEKIANAAPTTCSDNNDGMTAFMPPSEFFKNEPEVGNDDTDCNHALDDNPVEGLAATGVAEMIIPCFDEIEHAEDLVELFDSFSQPDNLNQTPTQAATAPLDPLDEEEYEQC